MTTECIRWIHTSDNLNIFEINKFEIIIIETIVCQNLFEYDHISLSINHVKQCLPVEEIRLIDLFPIYLISVD